MNPLAFIKSAKINETQGTFQFSDQYLSSDLSWGTSAMMLTANPVCTTTATEQNAMVADAVQWNMTNRSGAYGLAVPPPLKKIMFLRAGRDWMMRIPLDGGAGFKNVEITLRNNLGTRGDAQGTLPVISFSTVEFPQASNLDVVLEGAGCFDMALLMQDHTGATSSLYEMTWNLVP